MIFWMKAKLTTIIIAAVAVFTVAGASAVFAAQSHNGNSTTTPRTSAGASSQQAQEFEAQGVIQQITFDQGTTQSGSLVFLPTGKQTTVTVVFTTATHIEVGEGNSGDSSHDQDDDNDNDEAQSGVLQAGMTVKVEGTVQADGSVLAREINANAQDANDDNNNNNDQEDHRLTGVIQSIDTSARTFVLLPDGQSTPVTIAFDAQTRVDEDSQDGGKHSALTVGEHVRVEVVTRADGSLYAKEIQPRSGDDGSGDHNGDNGGTGDGGSSGSGSGDDGGSGGHDGGGSGGSGSGG